MFKPIATVGTDWDRLTQLRAATTLTTKTTICLRARAGGDNWLWINELRWKSRNCAKARMWFFVVFRVHVRPLLALRAPKSFNGTSTTSGSNLDRNVATSVSTRASIVTTRSFGSRRAQAKARGHRQLERNSLAGAVREKIAFDRLGICFGVSERFEALVAGDLWPQRQRFFTIFRTVYPNPIIVSPGDRHERPSTHDCFGVLV